MTALTRVPGRHLPRNLLALVGTCLALSLACSPPGRGPLVALEVEGKESTLDGCTSCGCRVRGELEPGGERDWWVSFGLAAPDGEGGWEASGRSSHCGRGAFEDVAADFERTVGTPYVVVSLSTRSAWLPDAEAVDVEVRVDARKLAGFDASGRPDRGRSRDDRRLRVEREGELTLPLLVADPREQEAFGVHEVFVRLRAGVLRREAPPSYGAISVSADVPGAEILLDGGFVGRVSDMKATLVRPVLAGTREVVVRDLSGREQRREVAVAEEREADAAFQLLGATGAASDGDLVPLGESPQGQVEHWRKKDGAVVVTIPAGEFLMGSPEGEGAPDEWPQRRVHVSEFLIDKTEVTWRQFQKFAEATGAELPRTPIWGIREHHPISFILWGEAQQYCEWVGGRLPTEAEWEKAARGAEGWKYPWGDAWDARRCNSISGGLHEPEAVGSYPTCITPYGVLDMSGSMWEWCADHYSASAYAEGATRDPTGPEAGRLRVKRGGAWMSQPLWVRTAYRGKGSPVSRNADHGFRCAQDPPGQP